MINLHGSINLDLVTLGLNAALYAAPDYGFFSISQGEAGGYSLNSEFGSIVGGEDALVVEGMVNFGIGFDLCTIGFAAGLVTNLAKEEKGGGGFGIKLGLNAKFDLGGGFYCIPGAYFYNITGKEWDPGKNKSTEWKAAQVYAGVSLGYSF